MTKLQNNLKTKMTITSGDERGAANLTCNVYNRSCYFEFRGSSMTTSELKEDEQKQPRGNIYGIPSI